MTTATVPAVTREALELRPGNWVREHATYRGITDDPDRDVVWHRYDGRIMLDGAMGSVRGHCGVVSWLPHDVRTEPPLILRLEVSETVPAKACKNCLRSA